MSKESHFRTDELAAYKGIGWNFVSHETVEGRAKWQQAAAHCFDLIYKGSGEIDITAKAPPEASQ